VVGVVVIALGLAAWFVVLPWMNGTGEPPVEDPKVSTPIERDEPEPEPEPELDSSRTPDIMSKPSKWSAPVRLRATDTPNDYYQTVIDTGVDDIIILKGDREDKDGVTISVVQAIDLGTGKSLWTRDNAWYWTETSDGQGLYVDEKTQMWSFVDLRTGELTNLARLSGYTRLIYSGDSFIITVEAKQFCARDYSNLEVCRWKAKSLDDWRSPLMFGDGRWLNTGDGVYDIATGKRAEFGADSGKDKWFYTGVSSFARMRIGEKTSTFQPWDINTDQALAPAVTIKGNSDSWRFYEPWLVGKRDVNQTKTELKAYSWSTGEELWGTQLQLGRDGDACSEVLRYQDVLVAATFQQHDHRSFCTVANFAAVDASTGKGAWKGDGYFIGAGQRVVYTSKSVVTGALTAFDSQDSAFTKLWSIKAPAQNQDVHYYALANHLIAIGSGTKQLWVLQTNPD